MSKYGNYYGAGWTAGGRYTGNNVGLYVTLLEETKPIDELDYVAMYHDIGLEVARDSTSGITSTNVNWASANMFWKVGGCRGKFAALVLWIAALTGLGKLYLSDITISPENQDKLIAMMNEIYPRLTHYDPSWFGDVYTPQEPDDVASTIINI